MNGYDGKPAPDPAGTHESETAMKKKQPSTADEMMKAFEKKDKEKKGGPKEGSKREESMDRKEMKKKS
jgi:hypothetical protein